jgi:hypothetical protein
MSVQGRGLVSDHELQQHLTVYSVEAQLEGHEWKTMNASGRNLCRTSIARPINWGSCR